MLRLILFTSFLIFGTISFSIPGILHHNFQFGDRIKVSANEFDSITTQISFSYYAHLFCSYLILRSDHQNFGSEILGLSTEETEFYIRMGVERSCQRLCDTFFQESQIENFIWMIENEYYTNLVVDNLPAIYKSPTTGDSHVGFPVGYKKISRTNKDEAEYFIYNHLTFKIEYDQQEDYSYRILGFTIEPQR